MDIAMGDILHTIMEMVDIHHEDLITQVDTHHREVDHQDIRTLGHLIPLGMEDSLLMALVMVHLDPHSLDHTVMVDSRPRILGDLAPHHHLGHLHHHLRTMIIPYLLLAVRSSM